MTQYRIRNWARFQHYKERNPPWIKLHVEILASEDWVSLADASKLLAVVCMVVAAKNGGLIPDNPDYIKRVAYLDKRPNLKPLVECGFLEIVQADASECKQQLADASEPVPAQATARPDTDTDTEREVRKKDPVLRTEQLSPLAIDPGSDLKTTIWNGGVAWLMRATGRTEAACRSVLGKWCRNSPEEQVWACMCAAQRDEVVEPIAWIEQALRTREGKSRHNALNGYRGQDELMEVLDGHAGEEGAAAPPISVEDDRRLLAAAARPGR